MCLEELFKEQEKKVVRRAPTSEALKLLKEGKKFIPVEKAFDLAYLPDEYMLINMQYKMESFKTIVPTSVIIYMSNSGEGNINDALDEITDFYNEVKEFEEENIQNGNVSIQGTNWAVTARSSYNTYLTNKLTRASEEDIDVLEWDEETIKELDLQDFYVNQRVRAIAAVALGLDIKQVKKYNINDVLKHVTLNERKVENLSGEEFDQITCWAGSHYEIRAEYQGSNNDIEYQIEQTYGEYKVGKKIIKEQKVEVFDAKLNELEEEIETYRLEKHGNVGFHDRNLIRQYANLAYITKNNFNVQLLVAPPEKEK